MNITAYGKQKLYLALINRAGGLYGRILTGPDRGREKRPNAVRSVHTARSKFSLTDRLSLVDTVCLLYGKQEKLNAFNETGLY